MVFSTASASEQAHELAEAVTDPVNTGWYWSLQSPQRSEIGDNCQWQDLQDVNLGGVSYVVQPLWDNATVRCVVR